MSEQEQLKEAVKDLVLKILERGRLNQQEVEGKIGVRDGGINMATNFFVDQIMTLAKTEAIALADKIIGKDVNVKLERQDIMDDRLLSNTADQAINQTKARQREILEQYSASES